MRSSACGSCCKRRQIFVLDDRRRHVPGRIDGDELHLRADHRRRLARLAGHDLGVPVDLVVVPERQAIIRHVDDDMRIAEIARQPAPALHVDDDGVDRIGGRTLCGGFLLAVQRAHRIGAEIAVDIEVGTRSGRSSPHRAPRRRKADCPCRRRCSRRLRSATTRASFMPGRRILPSGDMHRRLACFSILGLGDHAAVLAQFGELDLERLEFGLRRIVAVERFAGIAGVGELGQHVGRLGRDRGSNWMSAPTRV